MNVAKFVNSGTLVKSAKPRWAGYEITRLQRRTLWQCAPRVPTVETATLTPDVRGRTFTMSQTLAISRISPQKAQLQISDPAAILNGIAAKYESSTRLLMEYVDNSLDSAEEIFRESIEQDYDPIEEQHRILPREIEVKVGIDSKQRAIWISDNCGGIEPEALVRLVSNIGESRKKKVPWLNGQFGFGLHAFRAACKTLVVYSKRPGKATHRLQLDRSKSEFHNPAELDTTTINKDKLLNYAICNGLLGINSQLVTDPANSALSGTITCMHGFDPVWYKSLSASSIRSEIQKHFEHLLRRKNLEVSVMERGGKTDRDLVCLPFDYDALEGNVLNRSFVVGNSNQEIDCKFVVSPKLIPGKRPRFFRFGRSINFVSEMKSFMEVSNFPQGLWDHPSLSGFIEVGHALEPVITRDEFTKSKAREELYLKLRPIEKELHAALSDLINAQVDDSMVELESVLQQAVASIARNDAQAFKVPDIDLEVEIDNEKRQCSQQTQQISSKIMKDNVEYKPVGSAKKVRAKRKPKKHFDVRFVSTESNDTRSQQRSFVSGPILYINISHPDFVARMTTDSRGRFRFGSRAAAYLANEMACYYRNQYYDRFNQKVPDQRLDLYHELCDSVNSVETVLNKKLATLERKIRRQQNVASRNVEGGSSLLDQ